MLTSTCLKFYSTEYFWAFSTLENTVNCQSNGWASGLRSLTGCRCEKRRADMNIIKRRLLGESQKATIGLQMAAKYLSGKVRWITGCADSYLCASRFWAIHIWTLSHAHLDSELSTSGLWVMCIWTLSYAHLDSILCSSELWARDIWTLSYAIWTLNYAHLDSELCTSELLAMHIWAQLCTSGWPPLHFPFYLVQFPSIWSFSLFLFHFL